MTTVRWGLGVLIRGLSDRPATLGYAVWGGARFLGGTGTPWAQHSGCKFPMAHRTAVEFGPEMALSQGLLAPIGRIGNRLADKAGPARQSEDGSLAGGCTSSMQML